MIFSSFFASTKNKNYEIKFDVNLLNYTESTNKVEKKEKATQ